MQRVRFQQFSEKKNWQGIDVRYCGIPGGLDEEVTLLPEEEQHRKVSSAAIEALRYFHIESLGKKMDNEARNKSFGLTAPLGQSLKELDANEKSNTF